MSELERELNKVRAKQDAAMSGQAARGSTREGVFEAGIRAALDHAIENTDPSLARLELALGQKLDAGAFLMGMQCAAMAIQGVDAVKAAALYPGLFAEYIEKARQR